jgi:hypothetical protein
MVVNMECVAKSINPEGFGKVSNEKRRADQIAYCPVGSFGHPIQLR